jgi:predicted permease
VASCKIRLTLAVTIPPNPAGVNMSVLSSIRTLLDFLFGRSRVEREMEEELRIHLRNRTNDLECQGLSREEAERQARIEFGGYQRYKEECREALGIRLLGEFIADVRYGLRQFLRNPGFTAVAVATLAMGIGVNTTIFSLVSAMLLRKPPVADPDRLVMLVSRNPGAASPLDEANRLPASAPDFLDWRAQSTAFSGMVASAETDFTLSAAAQPEQVPGAQVSANYFQVLGVLPVLGRTFFPGEDRAGHSHVVLLREDLWKRRFGGDRHLLGRTVKISEESYTVVGVMPASFRRMWLFPAELWTPLVLTPGQLAPSSRKNRFLTVFARLKAKVSESQARAELATIARRIAAAHPKSDKGWGVNLMKVQTYAIQESNSQDALLFVTVAVTCVLLIACANIANLLLARNSNRHREFAVRAALGASRFRVARQLLVECLVLSVAGGGLGLLLAVWGVRLVRAGFNWNVYAVLTAQMLSIDRPVLLFTLALSVVSAFVFGLAPVFQISSCDLNSGLKENSRSSTAGREHHHLQNLLVVAELALSVILLVGAGLFVAFFIQEVRSDQGMNSNGVLTGSVSLSGTQYKAPQQQIAFSQSVLRQLANFPQVQSAAITSDLPFTFPDSARFAVDGRPVAATEKQSTAGYFAVSPGYFTTAQIPLHEGREFTPSDRATSLPVAVVNEAFARKFFPNQNALGHYISITLEGAPSTTRAGGSIKPKWREIVGVVSNVHEYLGEVAPKPHIFVPFLQDPGRSMNLMVRVVAGPAGFSTSLRRAVGRVDKDQPVTNVRTMNRVAHDSLQGDDLMTELMSAFAAIALLMATVGIYGLIAYLVGRRTHEMGVRIALGARRSQVLWMVLRSSMSRVLAGVGIGFICSLALPRLVTASFTGFHVHSGWILAGTPAVVTLVSLASCYFPARRAAKVDPMVALRYE